MRFSKWHWLLLASATIWLLAGFVYWRSFVPLRPFRSVIFPHPVDLAGITDEDEVVLVRTLTSSELASRDPWRGPVQTWKFPEGLLTQSLLDANDHVAIHDLTTTGEVASFREGLWSLYHLKSGERLLQVHANEPIDSYCRHPEDGSVICSDGAIVRCFNANDGSVRWKTEGYRNVYSCGPDFVVVGKAVRDAAPGWFSSGECPLRLSDGQPDSRFDHLGRTSRILISPNRERAAVACTGQKQISMCDAATGAVQWSVTLDRPVRNWHFQTDDQAICVSERAPDGSNLLRRWNVFDGAPLETIITHKAGQSWRGADSGSGLSVVTNDPNVGVIAWLRRAFARTPVSRLIPTPGLTRWLVDARTSKPLGIMTYEKGPAIQLPKDGGFLLIAGRHIDYFREPVTRNWAWLLQWIIVPPMLAFLPLVYRRRLHLASLCCGSDVLRGKAP